MADKRESSKAIGVFDSGIGGLTVVREIIRRLPNEDIVYLGDTARLPYGTKSPGVVRGFARENLHFLKSRDVKMIVVACNTASSVALPELADNEEIPVIGVIEPGAKAAVEETRTGRIGVIGTTATIRSGSYEKAIRRLKGNVEVWSHACPLFVPLVEEGWIDDEVTYLAAKRYLEGLPSFGADVLVLGCTHYPLIKHVIARAVGEDVRLVDSATETSIEVEKVLEANGLKNRKNTQGKIDVYVTDVSYGFREMGERFLGKEISTFIKIDLVEVSE